MEAPSDHFRASGPPPSSSKHWTGLKAADCKNFGLIDMSRDLPEYRHAQDAYHVWLPIETVMNLTLTPMLAGMTSFRLTPEARKAVTRVYSALREARRVAWPFDRTWLHGKKDHDPRTP